MYQFNNGHILKFIQKFRWFPAPSCFDIGEDKKTFVSGHFCGDIKIGCLETNRVIYHLRKAHNNTKWIRSVAINFNLGIFISGSEDKTIRIWSLNNGKKVHCFSSLSAVRNHYLYSLARYSSYP